MDGKKEEFRLGEVKTTIARDFKEARVFFLDEEHIDQLEKMGSLKRWLFTGWWLLKALVSRLTPARRFLTVVGLVCIFIDIKSPITVGEATIQVSGTLKVAGGLMLLFVLLLELKDKLLARDELVAGRSVQLALLPEASPEIHGWDVWLYNRPANDVGGDLIDYVEIEPNRIGMALGDVSGKGLPAALLMAKLQSTLRALVTEFSSLDELASKINFIFHRDSLPISFASMVYLELDPETGVIRMVNAGHLPPVVIKKGRLEFLDKGDRGLGISGESSYREIEIELQTGDLLIIYSDGLTEAQNEEAEFFGNERLQRLLDGLGDTGTRESGRRILEAVDEFIGEAPRYDDLSLVLLKRL